MIKHCYSLFIYFINYRRIVFRVHCRDEYWTVCVTQSLAGEFPLNTEQPIKIVFLDANMTDEETKFTFTYKPDPVVKSIHPDVTILR